MCRETNGAGPNKIQLEKVSHGGMPFYLYLGQIILSLISLHEKCYQYIIVTMNGFDRAGEIIPSWRESDRPWKEDEFSVGHRMSVCITARFSKEKILGWVFL